MTYAYLVNELAIVFCSLTNSEGFRMYAPIHTTDRIVAGKMKIDPWDSSTAMAPPKYPVSKSKAIFIARGYKKSPVNINSVAPDYYM